MQGKIWLRIQLSASSVFCFFLTVSNCPLCLPMPLSFRSNVNYIPPPQEVSCFFSWSSSSLVSSPSLVGLWVLTWAKRWFKHEQLTLTLMNIAVFLIELVTPSQRAITLNTEYLNIPVCVSLSPRILNTPSHSCSDKLAFLWEHITHGIRFQHWIFSLDSKWALDLPIHANFNLLPPQLLLDGLWQDKFARLLLTLLLCCVGPICHWRFLLLWD